MKRATKSAAEIDVACCNGRHRRTYCYLKRAGATAGIKRQMRRRERRESRTKIAKEREGVQ